MKQDQVSSTALTVLQGVAYVARSGRDPELVPRDLEEASLVLLEATPEGQARLRQLDKAWFRRLVPVIERLMMPGITRHYVYRKRTIERAVLAAIERGATQVVNLGAGFDTLAMRLAPRYPAVRFIELDHPATQRVKRDALMNAGIASGNLHLLPADFATETLAGHLTGSGVFDLDRETVAVVEGVLMYLDEAAVRLLFQSLHAGFRDRLTLVFTVAEPSDRSRHSYGPLLKLYLRIKGEALHWTCAHEQLPVFLEALDYRLEDWVGGERFRSEFDSATSNAVVHQGEYVAVAERLPT